jgi:hypothetical protein
MTMAETTTTSIRQLLRQRTDAWNSIITLTAVDTRDGRRFASFQNTRVSDPEANR